MNSIEQFKKTGELILRAIYYPEEKIAAFIEELLVWSLVDAFLDMADGLSEKEREEVVSKIKMQKNIQAAISIIQKYFDKAIYEKVIESNLSESLTELVEDISEGLPKESKSKLYLINEAFTSYLKN